MADTIEKINPPDVVKILKEKYNLISKDIGPDQIDVVVENTTVAASEMSVFFEKVDRDDIRLYSLFNKATRMTVENVNNWNQTTRWSKAYINKGGNAVLEFDVSAKGGITNDALTILIATYMSQVKSFADHIGVKV